MYIVTIERTQIGDKVVLRVAGRMDAEKARLLSRAVRVLHLRGRYQACRSTWEISHMSAAWDSVRSSDVAKQLQRQGRRGPHLLSDRSGAAVV